MLTPEAREVEAVALDPRAHILDRIEAWCDLAEFFGDEASHAHKVPLCLQQIKHLCEQEKQANW